MGDSSADLSSASSSVETLVADWCARDHGRAFLQLDHQVIDSTTSVRALIAEHLIGLDGAETDRSRDLFNAFGVLGRLLATRGGSPSLAAFTLDGALEAARTSDASWVVPSRATLAEGYAAARHEQARAEATGRWEYPMCAVPLHEGIVAIAAGYPDDDEDALAGWAARVANAAVLSGARRVVVSGPAAARAALAETLNVAGIELLSAYEVRPRPAKR
jgi:hypothetical protein